MTLKKYSYIVQSFWSSSQSFFPDGGLGPPAGFAIMILKIIGKQKKVRMRLIPQMLTANTD